MICYTPEEEMYLQLARTLLLTGAACLLVGALSLIAAMMSRRTRAFFKRYRRLRFSFGVLCPMLAIIVSFALMPTETARAKISEGVGLAAAVKTATSEYWRDHGQFPSSNKEAGISEQIRSKYVQLVSVGDKGVITITFAEICDNHTLFFTPSIHGEGVSWDCRGGTLPSKYRWRSCR